MGTPERRTPRGDGSTTIADERSGQRPHRSPDPSVAECHPAAFTDPNTRLLTVTAHRRGRGVAVSVYSDRIQWTNPRAAHDGVGVGLNMGVDRMPVRAITSVTAQRDGILHTVVSIVAAGHTVDFRVMHSDAHKLETTLASLINESDPSPCASEDAIDIERAVAAAARACADVDAELGRLAALHDGGVLSDEEFTARRLELLGRF